MFSSSLQTWHKALLHKCTTSSRSAAHVCRAYRRGFATTSVESSSTQYPPRVNAWQRKPDIIRLLAQGDPNWHGYILRAHLREVKANRNSEENWRAALQLFQRLLDAGEGFTDIHMHHEMLRACKGADATRELLTRLQFEGFTPSNVSFSILVEKLASTGRISEAEAVVAEMRETGLIPDENILRALNGIDKLKANHPILENERHRLHGSLNVLMSRSRMGHEKSRKEGISVTKKLLDKGAISIEMCQQTLHALCEDSGQYNDLLLHMKNSGIDTDSLPKRDFPILKGKLEDKPDRLVHEETNEKDSNMSRDNLPVVAIRMSCNLIEELSSVLPNARHLLPLWQQLRISNVPFRGSEASKTGWIALPLKQDDNGVTSEHINEAEVRHSAHQLRSIIAVLLQNKSRNNFQKLHVQRMDLPITLLRPIGQQYQEVDDTKSVISKLRSDLEEIRQKQLSDELIVQSNTRYQTQKFDSRSIDKSKYSDPNTMAPNQYNDEGLITFGMIRNVFLSDSIKKSIFNEKSPEAKAHQGKVDGTAITFSMIKEMCLTDSQNSYAKDQKDTSKKIYNDKKSNDFAVPKSTWTWRTTSRSPSVSFASIQHKVESNNQRNTPFHLPAIRKNINSRIDANLNQKEKNTKNSLDSVKVLFTGSNGDVIEFQMHRHAKLYNAFLAFSSQVGYPRKEIEFWGSSSADNNKKNGDSSCVVEKYLDDGNTVYDLVGNKTNVATITAAFSLNY